VGVGSLSSAVPQLRRREIQGPYLSQGEPAQPLLSGKAVDQFATTMLNAVMTKVARDNKLYAKEAYFKYSDGRRALEQEYYAKTGQDAVRGHAEFEAKYKDLFDKSLESLNPGARQLAMDRFMADRESTLTGAAKHAVAQKRIWEKDTQAEEVERSFLGLEKHTYDMAGAAKYIRDEATLNFKLDTPGGRAKALKFSNKAWATLFQMRLATTKLGNAAIADKDLREYASMIGDQTQVIIQKRIEQAYNAEYTLKERNRVEGERKDGIRMRQILIPIIDKTVTETPLDDDDLFNLKAGYEMGLITTGQYRRYLDDNQKLGSNSGGFDSNLYIDLENRVIQGTITDEDFALEVKDFPEKQRVKLYALRKSETVKRYNRDFRIQTNRIQAAAWDVPVNPFGGEMADKMFESVSQKVHGERKALNVEYQTQFFNMVNDPEDKRTLREKADSILSNIKVKVTDDKYEALVDEYKVLSGKKVLAPWERERYNYLGKELQKHLNMRTK
jgi:hypothetical protein